MAAFDRKHTVGEAPAEAKLRHAEGVAEAKLQAAEGVADEKVEQAEIAADKRLLQAQRELAYQRDIFERFFALSLDMMCISSSDGSFLRVSPSFDALGYSREELLSIPVMDLVYPDDRVILRVEDSQMDEELALRALEKSNVVNPVVVERDGVEALDYLFARGAHANRDPSAMPQVVLLDVKLPKLDGLEVLGELRSNELTRYLPVVILTSAIEDEDLLRSYSLGANSYVRKPVDFVPFIETVRQLGLYWLELNEGMPR